MSSSSEEDVGEIAFLVHDARDVAVVIEPRRRRLAREALDAAEGKVLNDDLRPAVLHLRVVVPGVKDDGDVARTRIRGELREERDRLDAGVAVLVPDALVVHRAEGVVEAAAPVLGGRGVQRCAGALVVQEWRGVQGRLGVRRIRDVVDVEAPIC